MAEEESKSGLGWSLKTGLAGGLASQTAFICAVWVVMAGANSRAFTSSELLKLSLVMAAWMLVQGSAVGLAAGVLFHLAGRVLDLGRDRMKRLGWIFFILLLSGELVLLAGSNSWVAHGLFSGTIWFPVLALAVLVLGLASVIIPAVGDSRLWLAAWAGVVVIAVAASPLLLGERPSKKEAEALAPGKGLIHYNGQKLILLGIDGMSWTIADKLLAEGRMPNFEKMIENGSRSPLKTFEPTASPLIWTTVATGKTPEEHRIKCFVSRTVPFTNVQYCAVDFPHRAGVFNVLKLTELILSGGELVTQNISSANRGEKAIWNMLDEQGEPSGVIHWWATWPAEKIKGVVVSDRVIYFRDTVQYGVQATASGLTWPPELMLEIKDDVVTPEKLTVDDWLRYMDISPTEAMADKTMHFKKYDVRTEFPYALSLDESVRKISVRLIKERPEINFWAVYSRGVDILSHSAMQYSRLVKDPDVDPADVAKYGRVQEQAYIEADRLIGALRDAAGPDAAFLIMSDHGFEKEGDEYNHHQAPDGVLVVSGGPFKTGAHINAPSVYDIAPTVLEVLGMPVGEDMHGRVLTEVLSDEFLAKNPVRKIKTYGPFAPSEYIASDSRMDQDIKEHLKALGYIK